jgi:hypothetical protein
VKTKINTWLAMLFGEKRIGRDGDFMIVAYLFRGNMYVTYCGSCAEIKP